MSFSADQSFEAYVSVYDELPEKWEEGKIILVEQLKKISNAVNVREIGWFLDQEVISGKQFIPSLSGTYNEAFRTVMRKTLSFGALPNATTKSLAHGINFNSSFSLVSLWAAATNPTNLLALQIPYSSPTLNQNISINLNSPNINITTAIDYSAYTICYVTIEYLLEA